MKKILVTGGTVFVSRYVAEYYASKGNEVYVLNRNSRQQSEGVNLIEADRHDIGDLLKGLHFDIVIDTAYTDKDVKLLIDAIESYDNYILISSSAVYPETAKQPFIEETNVGMNKIWGDYGTNKIAAEEMLQKYEPEAYILRPPYLYGPMNNVYREAFVFDCAMDDRKFYLPRGGNMKLQFFHVEELCRFIDVIVEKKPSKHIFNVRNKESISIKDWVKLCYEIVGKEFKFENVYDDISFRDYFSFHEYEYYLDVSKQCGLLEGTKSMHDGLIEAFAWYKDNHDKVNSKNYIDVIDAKSLK